MTDAAASSSTRTILLAGLGAVAVAAVVAFVVLPLLSGDDEPEQDTTDVVVVDDATPSPAPSPTEDFELAEPGAVEGDPPAETFEVFNARDPFQQLVEDAPAGDGTNGTTTGDGGVPGGFPPTDPGTTPGTDPGTGTPSPGTSPGTGTTPPPDTSNGTGGTGTDGTDGTNGTGDGTDGTDGSTGDGGNGSDAQVGGTQVTLVDVFDDDGERKATVTVNGTGYTVGEGETFARRFRLLDISGRCATMLFGDSRFTLCEGERIRK